MSHYEPAFTRRYEWATKITVRFQQNSSNYVRFEWTERFFVWTFVLHLRLSRFSKTTLTIIMWVDIIYSKATIHFPAHFICKSANTMENILRSFQIDKSHFRQLFRVDWMEEGNKSFINYLEQKWKIFTFNIHYNANGAWQSTGIWVGR